MTFREAMMDKLQLIALMSPAVGSFVLVILAWMQSNARLGDLKEDLGRRIGALDNNMNRQFDNVDQRFETVNRQFDTMNRQFDTVNSRLNRIEEDQKHFYAVTGKLDGRIDEIAKR